MCIKILDTETMPCYNKCKSDNGESADKPWSLANLMIGKALLFYIRGGRI